jgi:L-threonylcarbamoyladenylate synthase
VSVVQFVKVSAVAPEPDIVAEAAEVLRADGLVAFPTETVYGLGANALSDSAVAKIFHAKGRPARNPLIVHVADARMAARVVSHWPPVAERLAQAFWPGPLTMVLPRHPDVPAAVSAGLGAVGVRVPAHPVARALIEAAGCPVAAPSANPYMGVSPTRAGHVLRGMQDTPEPIFLLDGGEADVGLESTVLDLTGPVPTVLRPGGLPLEQLRQCLGEVRVLDAPVSAQALPSPGLARRHYAPRAKVFLVETMGELRRLVTQAQAEGGVVGVVSYSGPVSGVDDQVLLPAEPAGYARQLYASLHELDALGVEQIFIELPPADLSWLAVHDRLRRAATSA